MLLPCLTRPRAGGTCGPEPSRGLFVVVLGVSPCEKERIPCRRFVRSRRRRCRGVCWRRVPHLRRVSKTGVVSRRGQLECRRPRAVKLLPPLAARARGAGCRRPAPWHRARLQALRARAGRAKGATGERPSCLEEHKSKSPPRPSALSFTLHNKQYRTSQNLENVFLDFCNRV